MSKTHHSLSDNAKNVIVATLKRAKEGNEQDTRNGQEHPELSVDRQRYPVGEAVPLEKLATFVTEIENPQKPTRRGVRFKAFEYDRRHRDARHGVNKARIMDFMQDLSSKGYVKIHGRHNKKFEMTDEGLAHYNAGGVSYGSPADAEGASMLPTLSHEGEEQLIDVVLRRYEDPGREH